MVNLMTEHLDVWTSAQTPKANGGRGRGSHANGDRIYGIKKLRELILELAVRGKLVPQDPKNEAASALIEKIAKVRDRLVKEEGLKTKAKLKIGHDEEYIRRQPGWQYCRLGNLAKFIDYRGRTPKKIESGIPLITAKNVRFGFISREPKEFISEEEYEIWMTRGFPKKNDILFTTEAPLGNVAVVNIEEKFALAQRVICLQLHTPQVAPFLKIIIMSPNFQGQLIAQATGMTATGIKAAKLKEIPIPIPPLSEQHRIVAKVDELMVLCDQLEQQQIDSNATHQTLVETLLTALTSAANSKDFADTWQRIADHFDILFTTEQSIDQLKQSILQLAVMGKLVPQDPNDEPASVLLEKIAKEKKQLVKERKIKKQKPLPEIGDEEKPFGLPDGWTWCRLDDLALRSEAGWSPKCKSLPRTCNDWGVLKVSAVSWGRFKPDENKALPSHLKPKPEYEVMPGDFLISRANTSELVARAVVVPVDAPKRLLLSDKTIRFSFPSLVNTEFICIVNNSQFSREYYSRIAGGTSSSMKNVSREQIRSMVVALPPKIEQNKIVSKVYELMTSCDDLKTRLKENQTIQIQLSDAIVEKAVLPSYS